MLIVEEGGAIVTEVEEAYVETLPGAGAPANSSSVKRFGHWVI